MRSPARRIVSLAFAICCLASPALAQISTLRITEVMSSSGVGGTGDWWEATNYGSSAVDITGWKVDDSSFTFGLSVALNGITSINAGESVAFLETNTLDSGTVATLISSFRTFWGGSGTSAQIGYYAGSGISFSSNGDGIVMFSGTTETSDVRCCDDRFFLLLRIRRRRRPDDEPEYQRHREHGRHPRRPDHVRLGYHSSAEHRLPRYGGRDRRTGAVVGSPARDRRWSGRDPGSPPCPASFVNTLAHGTVS
jgi:hypothetical protein